jgi:hypothetical protein
MRFRGLNLICDFRRKYTLILRCNVLHVTRQILEGMDSLDLQLSTPNLQHGETLKKYAGNNGVTDPILLDINFESYASPVKALRSDPSFQVIFSAATVWPIQF